MSCSDVPRWRTHGGDFLYANGVNDALNFGDPLGAAYLAVSHPVLNAQAASRPADASGATGTGQPSGDAGRGRRRGDRRQSTTRDRCG